jgi:Xaa-Pro aminopeptidase
MPSARLRTPSWLALSLAAALAACAPTQSGVASSSPQPEALRAAPSEGWFTPGAPVSAGEYAERRAALMRSLGDGVFLALGADEPVTDYSPYAQTPPLRYLTGITEPGAALVMVKSAASVQELLFVQPRNPSREVWEGARLGAEAAQALSGIPTRTADALQPTLDSLLARPTTLYTVSSLPEDAPAGRTLTPEQQAVAALVARHPGTRVAPADRALAALRAPKSPAELDLIRRAVEITVLAQRAAMRAVEPGMNEFEIQALIEYTFRRNGAERPGFASIVGSGPNATTLHYSANDRYMQAGEMLVMDIGASYRGYTADVTRSVPVSGTFSPEQRAIYEVVLAAQKAAEAEARPGTAWQQVDAAANRTLAEGLARLGLIESATATYACGPDGQRECPQHRLFYLHGLGHGIGLDVHDPNPWMFRGGALAEGDAFTIEPGLYVRADALDYLPDTPANRALVERLRPFVERYRNIGVRIEDDYFITASGAVRVSAGAPREIAEIEALMRQNTPTAAERRADIVDWYRATEPR